jgi:hypothetical protein
MQEEDIPVLHSFLRKQEHLKRFSLGYTFSLKHLTKVIPQLHVQELDFDEMISPSAFSHLSPTVQAVWISVGPDNGDTAPNTTQVKLALRVVMQGKTNLRAIHIEFDSDSRFLWKTSSEKGLSPAENALMCELLTASIKLEELGITLYDEEGRSLRSRTCG